jgi:hypothetical protein
MAPTEQQQDQEKVTRTFKQSEDAVAGTTGFIFNGLYYGSEAELDADLDEKQAKQRFPRGRLARSAGSQHFSANHNPNALPGRSGSGVEQTDDIVTVEGHLVGGRPTAPGRAGGKQAGGKGAASEDLESLSKDELKELAAAKGVTVEREDGEEGEPLKSDYVTALKGK